ncbi:MAG: hypothetical protein KIS62_12430 [Ramlibacter sp.]|nr:hypothetical protein [Ramlibacter sp.]
MLIEFVRAVFGGDGFTEPVKVSVQDPLPTQPLGVPTVARQLALGEASSAVALSDGCARISIRATVAGYYLVAADDELVADDTAHYIGAGERLDIALPPSDADNAVYIAAIGDGADGTLYISELG